MQRDDSNKIHVRNIPAGTTEAELREHFSRAGEIVDFILKPADNTHMWAFIGFSNAADFQVALEMNNQEFKEATLEVTPKTQPPPRERRTDDRRCFRCNKTGHISAKCPSATAVDRKCFKCGRTGHMAHSCPDGGAGGGRRARSRSNDRDRSRERGGRRREDSRDRRRRDDSRDRRRRDDSRDRRRDDSRDRRRRDDRDDRRRDDRRRDDRGDRRRDDRRRDDRGDRQQ